MKKENNRLLINTNMNQRDEMARLILLVESAEQLDEGAFGKAVGAGALAYMLANNPMADKPKDVDAPDASPTQVTQPQAQSLEDVADQYMNKYKPRGMLGIGPQGSILQSGLKGTPEEALYKVMLKMSYGSQKVADQGMVRYLHDNNKSHPALHLHKDFKADTGIPMAGRLLRK